MAERVTLDAMIQRADFAIGANDGTTTEQIQTLSVESLSSSSMIVPMLRKPDFQRETNQWTTQQLVTFLTSYLDLELIPSVILWRSPAYVFVIDGGHRLSVLRAWIENDYGDGIVSQKYFGNEISDEQKRIADRVRKLVGAAVGTYAQVKDALVNPDSYDREMVQRARNMATRQLSLQWVVGDALKAESSFFKINTQGTPLDKTEETLLRNRKRPVAIAARSILRAGTGHKYWSQFDAEKAHQIVEISKEIHQLLFKPDLRQPIKTLALPLGGGASPVNALELLIRFTTLACASQQTQYPAIESFPDDLDGDATITVLKKCLSVASWLTGNNAASLGLHPAVYFYTDQGRHSTDMFLAFVSLVSRKLTFNHKSFFAQFIKNRAEVEIFLINLKPLLALLINAVTSRARVQKLSEFIEAIVSRADAGEPLDVKWAIEFIAPNSRTKLLGAVDAAAGQEFTRETKSAIFMRDSLQSALKCSICSGYLEPSVSVSYDHDTPVRDGGRGSVENGKLTHPYCNTGIKN
ncbi:MAG: DUF262 domain-containing protein [Sphingomonas sp.]|jgi:hypothetical protein|uniref:GmrSD restriction endonuclease domain-containing protein n=1 Tax=Sphingomonas sp. TaxID=28214 RepID=UPI0035637F2F